MGLLGYSDDSKDCVYFSGNKETQKWDLVVMSLFIIIIILIFIVIQL